MLVRVMLFAFLVPDMCLPAATDTQYSAPDSPVDELKWKKSGDRNKTGNHDLNLLVGDAVTFKCKLAPDVEKITWFLNQTVELTKFKLRNETGQRILLIGSGKSLDFTNVQLQDTGHYSCHSGNMTRHIYKMKVDEVHSVFDFRSPYNCLLAATLVVVVIFFMVCLKQKSS